MSLRSHIFLFRTKSCLTLHTCLVYPIRNAPRFHRMTLWHSEVSYVHSLDSDPSFQKMHAWDFLKACSWCNKVLSPKEQTALRSSCTVVFSPANNWCLEVGPTQKCNLHFWTCYRIKSKLGLDLWGWTGNMRQSITANTWVIFPISRKLFVL